MHVLNTLLAEVALAGILDVHHVSHLVVGEDLTGTTLNYFFLLEGRKFIYFVLVELYDWICAHYTGRNWTPLSVCLCIALLCD